MTNYTFVTLYGPGQQYPEYMQCSRSTGRTTRQFKLQVSYGEPGIKQPVLLQIGTTEGLDRSFHFLTTVKTAAGVVVMQDFHSSYGRTATSKPVVWLLPGVVYEIEIHIPPAAERRTWSSLGLRKQWVPRYNLFFKASKLGDGHTAEFGKD